MSNFIAVKGRVWGIEGNCISLDDLPRSVRLPGEAFLVSIDLDFFYQKNYTPRNIPRMFNVLLDYSIRGGQKTLWAVCLSYP